LGARVPVETGNGVVNQFAEVFGLTDSATETSVVLVQEIGLSNPYASEKTFFENPDASVSTRRSAETFLRCGSDGNDEIFFEHGGHKRI
jgi:hypothetical protein